MKLTKKLLPLAGIACVTAAAVPAIASCSCGKKEAGTFEVVDKEVLGTLSPYPSTLGLNKKSNAVFGVKLSKKLADGEKLTIEDVKFDSTSMDYEKNGVAVQVYPEDPQYAYVLIPVKGLQDAELKAKDTATIGFTLKSSEGTIKDGTFSDLVFKMSESKLGVYFSFTNPGQYKLGATYAAIDDKKVTINNGLTLISDVTDPTDPTTITKAEFSGGIYLGAQEISAENAGKTNKLTAAAWTKMKAEKLGTDTKASTLTFEATLDQKIATDDEFVHTVGKKGETLQILLVPDKSSLCPFYVELPLTEGCTITVTATQAE